MSESTRDMLSATLDSVAETVAEYARQIKSGEYGDTWTVTDADGMEVFTDVHASSESELWHDVLPGEPGYDETVDMNDWTAERDEADEPTVNDTSIDEWPLDVVVKIGRPLAVVVGTGGPHIEIVQEIGGGSAKLAGYWGGEQVYRHGDAFQTVLDYFVDNLYDMAPEEYK